jgi:hypothetical protein
MQNQYLSIKEANYLDHYKIKLTFNDGKENILDFEKFLFNSHHPDIQKYQDVELFKNFSLDYGDLEWNDYELAFPICDLYENRII